VINPISVLRRRGNSPSTARPRSKAAVAGFLSLTACLSIAACSSSSDSSSGSDQKRVAYLEASSANTWLKAAGTSIHKVAKAEGVKVTDFDAQFKSGEQSKQIQDIIADGSYDGIIIATSDGPGVIPDLEQAIDAGIKVVVMNQVIGTKLDTFEPQFKGVSASVLVPPQTLGSRWGEVTLKACADLDPCRVVYFYGAKGGNNDTGVHKGFLKTISENPAVKVVAEGEGGYLGPDQGLKEMKDIIQSGKKFDVVVGSDQGMQGVQLALEDEGVTGVKIVGSGGSTPAIAAIKAKEWFGGVAGLPLTEGELSMKAMVKALEGGKPSGGIDPAKSIPGGVLITQDNVDGFKPQFAG
jgi:ribose transport system substrate-binding protein